MQGGFTDKAYTNRVVIKRSNGTELEVLDLEKEEFESVELVNGDLIEVGKVLNRFKNRVQISGAVFREGTYQLRDSLKVSQLIKRADGIRGDAFINRASIYRTKEDFSTEIISFDLGAVLRGEEDYILQREDLVKIFSKYELRDEFYVEISGEVNKKGTYPYFENMTLEDIISLAGGIHESASYSRIEIARRRKNYSEVFDDKIAEVYNFSISKDLGIAKGAAKFILEPYDKVVVRRAPGYEIQKLIEIEGEVLYPGKYTIKSKGERISDIILRAGGLTPEAYPRGATLIRNTELYEPIGEHKQHLLKLQELKESRMRNLAKNTQRSNTEAEEMTLNRLLDLDLILEETSNYAASSARLKKERLKELTEKDSLVDLNTNSVKEAIGIDLEQILKNPRSKYDLILQEGDVISIPKELQTVRLKGELLYPITARYEKQNLRYYISQAGGFKQGAFRRKVYVIYPNGSVARTKNFLGIKNYPSIEPGTEIIVPHKPERRRLTTQEAIGLGTGMASLGMIVVTLLNVIGK